MATLYRDPYMRLRELAGLTERPDTSSVASPEELAREQRRAEYGQRSDLGNAVRQGVEDIRSSGYAVRGLARTLIGGEGAGEADLRRAQQITQDAEEFGPEVTSYDQVHDLRSAGQYALNSLGRLSPQLALALATGGAGGLAEGAAATGVRAGLRRLASNRARDIAERIAVRSAERTGASEAVVTRALQDKAQRRVAARLEAPSVAEAFKRGSERAVLANAVVQQSALAPDVILDPDAEGSARERALVALGGSVATGALDALPVVHLLRRYGLNGGLAEQVEGGVIKRVAKHAAKQGTEEGLTEFAQSVGERLTHKVVNDNVELLGPEAMADYINSAVAGFLGGGVFGAPGGLRGSGRESAQGQRWADSFRGYMGKFKRPEPAPDAPEAGPDVAVDLGAVVDRMKGAGTAAAQAAGKVGGKLKDVAAQADALTRRFMNEDAVEHSIGDILDAQPFGTRDVGTGEMLSEGNGVEGVKRFVDGGRVQALRAAGMPMREAVAAAFLPDAALTPEFRQSGALGEAAKALAGEDPSALDDAKISAFQNALPEDARSAFNRAAHTIWAMQGKDVELAPEGVTEDGRPTEEPATQEAHGMDEERPLPSTDRAIADWRRKGRHNLRGNALQVTDDKGRVRSVAGEDLGRMMAEHGKEDPEFNALPVPQKLAVLLGDFQRNGYTVDPASIGPLRLGKGSFVLAPRDAAALRNGLAPTQPPKATAPTQRATVSAPKTVDEARALNAEYGRGGGTDVAGREDPSQLDEAARAAERAPIVGGTPRTTPAVTASGKLLEGRAADSGTVDAEAQRAERKRFAPDDFNDLDRLLGRHTGEKVNGDFERRRALFKQAMADKRIGPRGKAELRDAAERYGEAQRAAALRKVQRAQQARDNAQERFDRFPTDVNKALLKTAKDKLRKARNQYEAATESVERTSGEAPRTGVSRAGSPAETARQQKRIEDDAGRAGGSQKAIAAQIEMRDGKPFVQVPEEAVENDVRASQEAVLDQLAGAVESRSRRGLYALKNKVLASSMSEPTKLALLDQIDAQLADLNRVIGVAGVAELSYNNRRDVTGEHFDAVRNAVKGTATLEAALRALLKVGSVRADLRALAQALLSSGAVRGVGFEATQDTRLASGAVNGAHQSATAAGQTLNSRVRLVLAAGPAPASVDPAATLLHEAVHAATAHAEQTNDAVRAELKTLLDHVRAEAKKLGYDPDAFYGLAETQEFLAEAFSNADLQNLLRQIKMPGEKRSAWDAFADFVAKVLGIERSALDAALDIGTRLATETGLARNAQYEAIFGESVEHSIHALTTTPASGSAPTDYMALLAPRERRYLEATFRRAEVRRQIATVLSPEQRAVLASADEGPALLVNTGVGLALAGRLDLSYRADTFKGALQGLWEIISKVLQLPSKAAYGRAILGALRAGAAPGAVDAQALLLKPAALKVTRYLQTNVTPKARALLRDMDGRMRATGVPALGQLATLVAQRTGEFRADGAQSFTARQLAERNQRLNAAYNVIGDWDDKTKQRVLAELQQHKAEVSPEAAKLRAFFKDMYDYLRAAGLPVGQTEHYFPVQVSGDAINARPEEFKALLDNFSETIRKREIKHVSGSIHAITEAMKARGDTALTKEELDRIKKLRVVIKQLKAATPRELSERVFQVAVMRTGDSHIADLSLADGEHDPSFRPLNARMMDYIFKEGTPEQIAQFASFQDQNLDRIVVQYVNRATRRAEWTRLHMGGRIKELLAKAQEQGATAADLDTAKDYIDMAMGTYGHDWNPFVKRLADNLGFTLPSFEKYDKLQTALVAYQNLRLLPLAAMSSLIDPLGVAVRSGELAGSFTAYKQAAAALRNKHGNDALRALAQDMGLVERHAVSEALTHLYGTANDPTGRAAKINALLFRFNGLEAITKFSRLAALAAGNSFLKFHAASDSEQSARYLTELGLKKDDILVGPDGFIVRNDKVDAALTRFVHEAVVRPTTGQRPSWQNDPNFRLAAQYKGYLYSFFNTITRRALHELDHGNAAVLLPLLLYLPVTALGELLRDMFQRDGKNKDAVDYAKQAVTRSGLLGPQISVVADGRTDLTHGHLILNSLGGPTGQQLGKAYDAMTRSGAGKVAEEALPASTLYKDWN